MGKRGPVPTPTALKLVQGTRSCRVNTNEPQPKEGLPQCPGSADPKVKEVWDYTLDQLAHMRIITEADRDALYAYCEAVVLHRNASRVLRTDGFLQEGMHGGWVKHPAHQIQRDAAAMMRQYAQEFGLTPSARSQIKLHVNDSGADKGAARLLSS